MRRLGPFVLLALSLGAQDGQKAKAKTLKLPIRTTDTQDLKKLLAGYEIGEEEFEYDSKKAREEKGLAVFDVTFPSVVKTKYAENNTVHARLILPEAKGKVPALIMVHWLGPNFEALEQICAGISKKGVATMFVYMPYYGPREPEEINRKKILYGGQVQDVLDYFSQAVKDVRRARDVLKSRPEIDGDRISLLGVSFGAIIGAVAAGVDPTFHRLICVVGGGDIAKIIFHGSEETTSMKKRFEELGYDEAKCRQALRVIEPLTYASRLSAERVHLFNVKHDEVIPKECTDRLRDAMGKPEITWWEGGHKWIALYSSRIIKETVALVTQPQ